MIKESGKYTAKETAEKIGLSYCYFMKLVRAGRFQHHRMSERKIYFTDEDIKAIEDSFLVKAESVGAVQ